MSPELELAWTTPPSWARAVLDDPLALLSDHAHCELGAAAAAQGIVARRPENSDLVERLSAHALDELRHFRAVHRLLVRLGGTLEPLRRSEYAEALLRAVERGPRNLGDRLLVAALIERRSQERFELLAAAASERTELLELARLYAELVASEAGHARLFLELARDAYGPEPLAPRLASWARREAEIARALPFAVRIHSGPPVQTADELGTDRTAGANAARELGTRILRA